MAASRTSLGTDGAAPEQFDPAGGREKKSWCKLGEKLAKNLRSEVLKTLHQVLHSIPPELIWVMTRQ